MHMPIRNLIVNQFITQWCNDNKLNEVKIRAAARSKDRMLLISDTHKQFPELSAVRLGEIFGLDHSSVLYALKKHGVIRSRKKQRLTPDQIEALKAMRDDGYTLESVAIEFGVSTTYVRLLTVPGFDKVLAGKAKKYRDITRRRRHAAKKQALDRLGKEARFRKPASKGALVTGENGQVTLVLRPNQAGE